LDDPRSLPSGFPPGTYQGIDELQADLDTGWIATLMSAPIKVKALGGKADGTFADGKKIGQDKLIMTRQCLRQKLVNCQTKSELVQLVQVSWCAL